MKRLSAYVLTAALCACGGHAGSALPPAAGQLPSHAAGAIPATFTIHIPAKTTSSSSVRRPEYVSPATQALSIVVDAGGSSPQTFDQNISSGAPGCNVPSPISALTCTIDLSVAAGAHTFDMTTYDQPLDVNGHVRGNPLSANIGFPFTILAGVSNNIPITLQGLPAGISIVPIPGQDVTGNQETGFDIWGAFDADGVSAFPRNFFVDATDADGNFILGTGTPTITVNSSDPATMSDGVNFPGVNPNLFTITPLNYVAGETFTYTFTATPSVDPGSASGATPLSLKISMVVKAFSSPRVYVTDIGDNEVQIYDDVGNPIASFGVSSLSGGIAYDPDSGLLYIANNGSITAYDYTGSPQISPGGFPISNPPAGIVYNPHNQDLYVGISGGGIAVYDGQGNPVTVSGTWKDTGGNLAFAQGGAYDSGNGHLYFADQNAGMVEEYDDTGNYIAEWAIAGPTGVVRDPSNGWLYVTTTSGVDVFDDSGNPISLPGEAFSVVASTYVTGVAYNPASGAILTSQQSAFVIEFDRNGNEIIHIRAGLSNPAGLVVVP
jgi:hypothetical protein